MIYLESVNSTITEDSYDKGLGNETGCGLDMKIGHKFSNIKELKDYIKSYYGLSDVEIEGQIIRSSNLVADHSQAQNGGWFEPTKKEIDFWKNGKMKLYLEEYEFNFHYIK